MKKLFSAIGVLGLLAACNSQPTNLSQDGTDTPAAALPVYAGLKTVPVSTQAAEPYNVTLVFVGNPSSAVQGVLNDAAARWQQVVTTGLADVSGTINAGDCGNPNTFSGTIDDVVIFAGVTDIDGPGGTLAQAGVCYTRTSGGLPVAGLLQFDTADVNSFATADLRNIALHEMGHELGIGTIWRAKGVLRGSTTSNPTFTGANANSAWVFRRHGPRSRREHGRVGHAQRALARFGAAQRDSDRVLQRGLQPAQPDHGRVASRRGLRRELQRG
jgi:hypothetical protein